MRVAVCFLTCLSLCGFLSRAASAQERESNDSGPRAEWTMSQPLVSAKSTGGLPWHSIKDPTIVQHDGKWHLFATMRGTEKSHTTVYLAFDDWEGAEDAERHLVPCNDGYFCAPQIFWYSRHNKWYLVCQASDESWGENPSPCVLNERRYREHLRLVEAAADVRSQATEYSGLDRLLGDLR